MRQGDLNGPVFPENAELSGFPASDNPRLALVLTPQSREVLKTVQCEITQIGVGKSTPSESKSQWGETKVCGGGNGEDIMPSPLYGNPKTWDLYIRHNSPHRNPEGEPRPCSFERNPGAWAWSSAGGDFSGRNKNHWGDSSRSRLLDGGQRIPNPLNEWWADRRLLLRA